MAESLCALQERIAKDMETALRSGDKNLLHTLRLVRADMQRCEKDQQVSLKDEDVVRLLRRMVKQRKESLKQYTDANRHDLAQQENDEIEIINRYLPAEINEADMTKFLSQAVKETNAQSIKDMSQVMKHAKKLMPNADMGIVAGKIKQLLS